MFVRMASERNGMESVVGYDCPLAQWANILAKVCQSIGFAIRLHK